MAEGGFSKAVRGMRWLTSAVLVLVVLYVGWIFYSRHQDEREAAERQAAKEAAEAQYTIEKYGSGRVKILAFSLSAGTIHRGQTAQLCYGVANAKSVKIDPPVGDIWPSMSHCVEVAPRKDTQYTITAQDEAGHTESAQIAIQVR